MTPEKLGNDLITGPLPLDDGRESSPVPQSNPRRLICILLPLLVLGCAAFVRLTALDSDPPPTLSMDFVSDETWWAHNARNHALFGRWLLDDFNQGVFAAPLHTLLERLSFAVGGINLRQTRIVSALSGLATILLIGLFMKREVGLRGSLAAMGILATDYFAVSFDRAGFVEPLPSAFMSLAIVLATWPGYGRTTLVLAGVAADLACLSKVNSIFFLATPLAWILMRPRPDANLRGRLGDAVALLVGMAVPLAIFGATFIAPNLSEYLSQNGRLREESKVTGGLILLNIFTISIQEGKGGLSLSGFLTEALLPTTLGLLWLLHAKSQAARHGFRAMLRGLTGAERIALLWIAAFMPYFALQDNSPDRRYYVFLAPLAILGAHLFAARREERIELQTSDLRVSRGLIVLSACFLAAALYLRVPAASALNEVLRDVPIGDQPGLSKITLSFLATGLTALIALPALWVILRQLPRSGVSALTMAVIVALVGGSVQIARFLRVGSSLTYTLDQTSHKFAATLEPDARVINGHPYILGSKCRNLILLDRRPVGYPYYGMNCLDEFRPTHILYSSPLPLDQATFDRQIFEQFGGRYRTVPRSLEVFESCPDSQGKMRLVTTLGRIVPAVEHLSAH